MRRLNLPQKLVVIHQFTMDMIRRGEPQGPQGLAITLNADGFGTQANKLSKYKAFTRGPKGVRARLQALLQRTPIS